MNVRNPRTGEFDYEIDQLSADDILRRCNQLRTQQQVWLHAGIDRRITALQQWKAAIERHKQELVDVLCTDTGRKWETVLEVELVISSIDRWCNVAKEFFMPPLQKPSSIPFIKLQQQVVPYQLVGVISPWNFPLLLSLIDTIPALLAGCAVMVKPSEITPRFIAVIQKTIEESEALKPVFDYIAGDGRIGESVVNHCDLVCFTGSTATGKKVYEAASKRMIPVFLEMGGKDPAIVLEGANLDLATSSILWGSTANAGQSCLSIERVYVQENIFDEFIQLLTKKAARLKLNAVNIGEGQLGPIIFLKQVNIINEHLKDALEKGATIVIGNEQCREINGGFYCSPTILVNVNQSMQLMQEETFGPLMPVMKVKTVDEAIALANDTVYGLGAAVFAKDSDTAMAVASQIHAGAISINDCALTAVMHEGEKNAFRLSGIGGTRMGAAAIKRFMRQKLMLVKDQPLPSPWWYGSTDV